MHNNVDMAFTTGKKRKRWEKENQIKKGRKKKNESSKSGTKGSVVAIPNIENSCYLRSVMQFIAN